ncbi:uncharacterized protein [Parasteatoda tepidariorum]|uniref:uncharacterized protein n=1 Tax=Parasteatoda tepidariorum TaxID=114398 RepID=UPI00077F82F7|nr:uncharacterized protein LOC107455648 [Parasteatoda tepidariorum]
MMSNISPTGPSMGNGPVIRKQQSTVSSRLVRCICITATFVVTGCGLLGFGLTCVLLSVFDERAAPCPYSLTITVFSVAGGLFGLSLLSFVHLCTRRKRLKREALLDTLPGKEDVAQYKKKSSIAGVEEIVMPPSEGGVGVDEKIEDVNVHPTVPPANNDEVENFAMTQKSADVSYWIEQQKPDDNAMQESYHLEKADGATTNEDPESDGEMTAL